MGSINGRRSGAILAVALLASAPAVAATKLKAKTLEAFQRYVQLSEQKIDAELQRGGPFLWVDMQPPAARAKDEEDLKAGKVVVQKLQTLDNNKEIEVPGGLIHHWVGTIFIPGATLPQVLNVVMDYDHHAQYYWPEVKRSKILSRQGDTFHIYLRLYKKKILTAVLDTEHTVEYHSISPTRETSRSYSTRIAEVKDAGEPDEHTLPPGDDDGYLWRINTYWRFEQKNGGVYIETQSISLTRDIPTGLGWLIGPLVESIPRGSLQSTLEATRREVGKRLSAGTHQRRAG